MAKEEDDDASLEAVEADINNLKKEVEHLEFQRMFNQEHDEANCFLEIQAGAGGTEAQDWASMLERMYIKFAERQSFKPEIVEETEGDVAGIKGCTIKITGDYAYGWLRTETGIHRLVRKSPFDSNARRHTSFASVFVVPEVDDSFEIEVNPADLRLRHRRSAHSEDRLRRPYHAYSDRHSRCQPDQPKPASEQGRGHDDFEEPSL